MRMTTLSLLSILPFIGSALGGTACKPGATTAASVIGVGAVATDGSAGVTAATEPTGNSINPDSGLPSTAASTTAGGISAVATDAASSTGAGSASVPVNTPAAPSVIPSTLELKEPSKKECGCGYNVSAFGGFYMPYRFAFDFSTVEDKDFTGPDDLLEYGFRINKGHHVGGPSSTGTSETGESEPINQCLGDPSSVSFNNGSLLLTMKANQVLSGEMKCPEVIHNNSTLYGIFQSEIQLTDTPGTCQAMWLNHTDSAAWGDELDIEVIGGAILSPNAQKTPPGLYSSNWDPMGDPNFPLDSTKLPHTFGKDGNKQPDPFPSDPTGDFQKFAIAWLPGDYSPRYYNGKEIGSPKQYNAIHPQELSINNWSNGSPGWSAGPPTQDSKMRVRSVLFYYRTEEQQDLIQGCKLEDICEV
ncbi:uncharacterized protein IL334_005874 [Kwoniella shivajii]|uniref:GH16 domain-containing protein n=1 Tax=Kwoniella shivajii TaxID=564305 RepID=A0ABZ1D8B9_9TREE|nr:hypothetical protein IL334_005874 [Kwoniella shivajii]